MAALSLSTHPPPPPTLYAHTVRVALARAVRAPRTEYLVEDLRTGEVLADTFDQPAAPIPAGSLLKPFLVFAHAGSYPRVLCQGHSTGCWRAGGHGELTVVPALAYSCNTWFLALTATPEDAARLHALGLPDPPSHLPRDLIGLTAAWPIGPLTLAEAYVRLVRQASPELLAGLELAATHGTASRIGRHPGGVLAKTGTAPCADPRCRASGDGLAVALAPALHPTTLVLVRRRATTGAVTAGTAGEILTTLEQLHAH